MRSTRWTAHGHDLSWFAPDNWTAGVPAAGEATYLADGGTWAISLAGRAHATSGHTYVLGDMLTFSAGTLDLATSTPKTGYPVDLTIGRGGGVTVAAGAALTSHYIIDVGSTVAGSYTAGSLMVQGTVDGAFLDIHDGSVQVAGAHAHVALIYDGYSATVAGGTLAVSDGGRLDSGPNSLANEYSTLQIGAGTQDGFVTVTGPGSTLNLNGISLGDDSTGVLTVSNHGTVRINYLDSGNYGATQASVSGTGSVLSAVRGISIGNDTSLSGLTLTVIHGASVSAGTYGLALRYGALVLDASAKLSGAIYSQVGQIDAVAVSAAAPGTVTLSQAITLDANLGAQGQYGYDTDVYSQGGAVLKLAGQISSYDSATLSARSGIVVLSNGANSFTSASIYAARLEIAATGAAGAGAVSFVGNDAAPGVLQIDAGVAFGNTVAGFAGHDTIDLRGFAFGGGVTGDFGSGVLVLSDGSGSTTLSLAGSYASTNFTYADDHHGGTKISFTHG